MSSLKILPPHLHKKKLLYAHKLEKGYLKGQCHEIFWYFFISWIEAIWAPDKLRAVLACGESDSAQANTVRSRTLRRLTLRGVRNWNILKSKRANTAQSWTPGRLTLHGVENLIFRKSKSDQHCAEFCREQFCLCRPLLAFKGNVTQKRIHRCAIQTKAHIFYWLFKGLALKKKSTPCGVSLCGVEFFEL